MQVAVAGSPPSAPSSSVGSIRARLRPELAGIVAGCVCLAATNGLSLTIPWLIKGVIDALRTGARGSGNLHALVVRDALLIAAFATAQAVIRTWSRILIFNAGRNIEYRLRGELFRHLLGLDAGFYRQHPTGDVMSRMTNDLGAVRSLFGPGLLNLFNTALVYATTLWLLVHLSPRLTLWALLPYPALLVGARLSSRKVYASSRAIQEQLGVMSTSIQEDLAGVAVIKHYTLEATRGAKFRALNDEYLGRSLALVRARGTLSPLFAMLGGAGTLIVLWAGGREVILGRMTIGALVAFNAYLVLLSWPTIALGWIIGVWQRGIAAWARVRDLLETAPRIADGPATVPGLTIEAPSIEVRDLTIEIDGRRLLDRVSFSLPAGATLAIVGPTGAGKTTLVDALCRMQEVAPGAVQVGGHDLTRIPLRTLRAAMGYAPQDAFLFSATVAENIGFGREPGADGAANLERIRRAAEAAGLAPDLAIFPDGLDTVVGERGLTLSGGQRQRVALARALCAEPKVLILDDSLSSVDAQTEREILTRLRPILKGRTSIVISHRVAAVKDADQILVLDAGRVAEAGTHGELLRAGGLYASLYRTELDAEALAAQRKGAA
ncbi:MAG TPA: ABC transporter ATP-binding protein [Polyangia bacterium]|nr:ABC transporter ATP-binding protein [Polyangia bacterium]